MNIAFSDSKILTKTTAIIFLAIGAQHS